MKRNQISVILLFFLLTISLITACSMEISKVGDTTVAPTTGIITATLYPTFTPRATATLLPATAIATVEPVLGKATAQINVRQRPSTASESIGALNINSEVQIFGKDATETWYQIYFVLPSGARGEGWAAADYILTESKPDVPVTSGGSTSGEDENANGSVTQQVNVRSGPGTEFDALGMLNIGDGIVVTGKNLGGTWLQIEYTSGLDGKGWLFAAYVETSISDELPIINEAGDIVGISTQTSIAATASPVYTPAPDDGDTTDEPAILVTFSTNDSRAFSYSSDVSSPEGDEEDWVAFHPNSPDELRVNLLIDLECSGNGSLIVEMWQGGIELTEWGALECGDSDYKLSMFRDETYQFRLRAKRARELEYIQYTLQVRVAP
ncbi:MAG: SH3 domain-containing protein [Anaerolineae bacterium]|jgi:uncharacterized protein YraI|nr:SH3 domain-containing protein [Anaerolineae bacterium]MBT7070766.1 SH3 domain-containing protein [Anaerolineae bacterium]MBT7324731.1 SH3 domain-containing protein [Anaerolineae bacterium]